MKKDVQKAEDKMKNKGKLLIGCMAVSTAIAVAGLFFQFLQFDFSPFFDYVPKALAGAIRWLSGFFGLEEGKIGFTGAQLISKLIQGGNLPEKSSLEAGLLDGIGWMVLVPVFLSWICLALCFFRNRWTSLTGLLVSLLGVLFLVYATLFAFPQKIYEEIPAKSMKAVEDLESGSQALEALAGMAGFDGLSDAAGTASDYADKIRHFFSDFSPADMQRVIFYSLRPGWWMMLASLLLAFVLFIFSLASLKAYEAMEEERLKYIETPPWQRSSVGADGPAVVVQSGSMEGARIVLQMGTRLAVGRDPGQCMLVMEEPGIDPLHCVISYDMNHQEYHVRDYSRKGVWCEGFRLDAHQVNLLPGDTCLYLGSPDNVLYLEPAPLSASYSTGYTEE